MKKTTNSPGPLRQLSMLLTKSRSKTAILLLLTTMAIFSGGLVFAMNRQGGVDASSDSAATEISHDASSDVTPTEKSPVSAEDKKLEVKNANTPEKLTKPEHSRPAAAPSSATPVITPAPAATPDSAPAGIPLFVRPNSPAAPQAVAWSSSRPSDAAVMSRIAATPSAQWFGDWTPNPTGQVDTFVSLAVGEGKMPVLVAYNIPHRDCGSYSAGGASSSAAYAEWIQAFANGIGKRNAIVIIEPDGLAAMDCLSTTDQNARIAMISDAVSRLRTTTNASIYIDAGNATWIGAATMAARLNSANITQATGFALNVSNFLTTGASNSYGAAVSGQVGGKHYVIDTSRNGNGSNGEWCNPSGRALGQAPTLSTGVGLADAYLWVKGVGESDGTCNGGPAAGTWWPEYALDLARNAGW